MGKYRNPSAVYALIIKDNKVLLQKRAGHLEGYWDAAASGHVEENESMTDSLVRELEEEIGIVTQKENLKFVTMIHSYYPDYKYSYYNGYFLVEHYNGEATILEPEKSVELRWFSLDNLPEKMYPDRKLALKCYRENIPYAEYGWDGIGKKL